MKVHEPKPLTKEELELAPWMKVALGEYKRGVRENPSDREFEQQFYHSLAQHNSRFSLLDWNKLDHEIARHVADQAGPILMESGNPDISKYFRSTKLNHITRRDSIVDKKTHGEIDHEWRMQAWCAAFVNWSFMRAGVKPLGSTMAADWLRFGMPVLDPRRGAVVVVSPSKATNAKGGSGHVAFFGGQEGDRIWLLGGNQSRKVSWMQKSAKSVRGYRWPKILGDFEKGTTGSIA